MDPYPVCNLAEELRNVRHYIAVHQENLESALTDGKTNEAKAYAASLAMWLGELEKLEAVEAHRAGAKAPEAEPTQDGPVPKCADCGQPYRGRNCCRSEPADRGGFLTAASFTTVYQRDRAATDLSARGLEVVRDSERPELTVFTPPAWHGTGAHEVIRAHDGELAMD